MARAPTYELPDMAFNFGLGDDLNHHQPLAQMPGGGDTKIISVNVADFIRTRDSLGSAFITLSSAVDKAVKAYIDHTNVVLAGDSSLNVSFLQQPFLQLAQTAQQALLQGPHPMAGLQPPMMPNGALAGVGDPGKDGKRKRSYKKRDPNAPKRPLTAYFRFLQEQRGQLSKEMANKGDGQPQKPGDLTKLATEKWSAMTEAQQKPYRDQYKTALKDYEKEVKAYKAATGGAPIEPAGPTTVVAGPDADEDEDDDSSSSDDSDSSSDDDEEEEEAPPPPPKPTKSKKSSAQASSSPERKRKSGATEDAPAAKRSRKGKGEKEAAAPIPEPEPSSAKKDKKKKKKKTAES